MGYHLSRIREFTSKKDVNYISNSIVKRTSRLVVRKWRIFFSLIQTKYILSSTWETNEHRKNIVQINECVSVWQCSLSVFPYLYAESMESVNIICTDEPTHTVCQSNDEEKKNCSDSKTIHNVANTVKSCIQVFRLCERFYLLSHNPIGFRYKSSNVNIGCSMFVFVYRYYPASVSIGI